MAGNAHPASRDSADLLVDT